MNASILIFWFDRERQNLMRILVVKTSSLGDLVHMLPALSDAVKVIPNLRVDWVAEEGFSAVPAWHPAVERVIPVAIRRWRKTLFSKMTWQEISAARNAVREVRYDAVIDAQGLLKSACLARWARGERWGYDRHSIREPLASLCYDWRASVPRELHAIERNRRVLAAALGYGMEDLPLDYGLAGLAAYLPPPSWGERSEGGEAAGERGRPLPQSALTLSVGSTLSPTLPRQGGGSETHTLRDSATLPPTFVLALHGTSRVDKEWPEADWITVSHGLAQHGRALLLPWGNAREKERAERIAAAVPSAHVLPRLGLDALAAIIARADAVLGVDTGLMHVAAALRKPGLALFPATLPALTGVRSEAEAPQIASLTPQDDLSAEAVLARLQAVLA
jgi:heptosyltransferase-1